MTESLRTWLIGGAAVGCGLMAGIFYTFSAVVMPALAERPAPDATASMQQLNVTIVSPSFLVIFGGTALVSVALVVLAVVAPSRSAWLAAAGGALYLIGAIVVTAAVNVPKNDALATIAPDALGSAGVWARYLSEWTAWNHVRTASSVAALALFLGALA